MRALVLAGGAGTRLRPITHTSAKQLVPVANKPILFYGLEDIASAGIIDVGMVVGDTEDEIRAAVGDGSRFGLKVTYLRQEEPLGLAHCVLIARDFLGEDDFVMYLGDNLLRRGVAAFVQGFMADRAGALRPTLDGTTEAASAQILLSRVPDPHRFGVAELSADGASVVRLVEKPEVPPSDLALVGVYLFTPAIHQAVQQLVPSARGELEITEAIQWLIDAGHRVRHEVLDGYWKDTGTLEALLEGNRLMLEQQEPATFGSVDAESQVDGKVVIQEGAMVVRSTIRGPVIVGERTRIIDSYLGPFTAVYHDCEIVESEIEHSVVLERSRVEGVSRIVDSLIGKEVVVRRSDARPRAARLMVGDHSQVEVP